MRTTIHFMLLWVILTVLSCHADQYWAKPNIVFFLVDDMGWQDTSVPFWKQVTPLNNKYKTPNMERLAREGILFRQAYAASVCSPTRTSLMTGMNAARHRVTNWTLNRNKPSDGSDSLMLMPEWNVNGLQAVDSIERSVYATTLPAILRDNGYFTIHVGKGHWGAKDTPGADPINLGFDINVAGHHAGAPASYQGVDSFRRAGGNGVWDVPGLEKYHGQHINLTEALTREAIDAIEQSQEIDKPFYLYMSHYGVHIPLMPHHPYYQSYIDVGLDETEARYASMIEGMDKSLGDLMDYLERSGLRKNTVILFISDNGGLSVSNRGGEPNTHNAPLRSGKGSAYEGGTRVPMLASMPGSRRTGEVSEEQIIIEDFFPTILELAGVKEPPLVQEIDGMSFYDILVHPRATSNERPLIWHYPNIWGPRGPGIGATSTIRQGDWKLIYWYKDGKKELYNLAEDIAEQLNLTADHPDKVQDLSRQLADFLRRVEAQRPTWKENGLAVPWPDER